MNADIAGNAEIGTGASKTWMLIPSDSSDLGVPTLAAPLRRAALGADTASPGSDYFCAAAI
jgi:hypothetical protein